TTHGLGLESHFTSVRTARYTADAGASLKTTNLMPLLANPRLLRSVSEPDAIGMVAFEDLTKRWHNEAEEDETGIFVGAQCASANDQAEYMNPLSSVDFNTGAFGRAYHLAHPMTLLRGLTN